MLCYVTLLYYIIPYYILRCRFWTSGTLRSATSSIIRYNNVHYIIIITTIIIIIVKV